MVIFPLVLAAAGFVVTFGSVILYFRTIPRGKVPEKVGGFAFSLILGMLLAFIAIAIALRDQIFGEPLIYILGVLTLFFGGFILWVLSQRKIQMDDLKVRVGEPLLPFTALTSEGDAFDSDSLAGKRVLFKFFRGGWCPYCSAELVSFNRLGEQLKAHGVEVMALSKDTIENASIHKARDELDFTLLCDPELRVIRQYGVEHRKALGQSEGSKTTKSLVGGIPLGMTPFSFQAMAIPTTLLIDEQGVIQWIDQTDDYRLRSNEKRVMDAVKSAFEN
ncbi:peroxiredoxin family protein [Dongshaea marina]|uniref:peroxiredoxin family protein n=1 Tax=Dongshaea marina TaxID=2047966 RepID=UPI000D3E3316|nr:peroxiredoxin family protein [Dongshaea marina]